MELWIPVIFPSQSRWFSQNTSKIWPVYHFQESMHIKRCCVQTLASRFYAWGIESQYLPLLWSYGTVRTDRINCLRKSLALCLLRCARICRSGSVPSFLIDATPFLPVARRLLAWGKERAVQKEHSCLWLTANILWESIWKNACFLRFGQNQVQFYSLQCAGKFILSFTYSEATLA